MHRRVRVVAISAASSGNNTIVAAVTGKKITITTLFFTVAGEVNVTLYDAATAMSGAMDFGGTSEPRGMVASFFDVPLELRVGRAFIINLSGAVQISGTVAYYLS